MSGPRPANEGDALLGANPRLVFEPASEAEAAQAMAACARDGLRVAILGGGTDLGLGRWPEGVEAVIRTAGLGRVLEHAPQDQIVRVEAGITLAALQAHLAPHGQRLALDPPFASRATAGGLLCANGFGALRTSRGTARDLVIGLSLVRADAVVARGGGKVVKNVAGFDLPRVFFGSLGTLGLVTAVNFRLHPLPEARATLLLAGLRPAQVRQTVKEALDAQVEPAAVAALGRGQALDLGVRFEGFGPGVEGQLERLARRAGAAGLPVERLDAAGERGFWARHDALREQGPFRARLAAPPAALEQAVAAAAPLEGALAEAASAWYPTLGLGFLGGVPGPDPAVAAAVGAARGALLALGGHLVVAEASAGVRSRVDVLGPRRPAELELMRRLKLQLDPGRILAPGRMAEGI